MIPLDYKLDQLQLNFKQKHSKHSKYSKILVEIVQTEQIKAEEYFLKSSKQIRLQKKRFRKNISLYQKTILKKQEKNAKKVKNCISISLLENGFKNVKNEVTMLKPFSGKVNQNLQDHLNPKMVIRSIWKLGNKRMF